MVLLSRYSFLEVHVIPLWCVGDFDLDMIYYGYISGTARDSFMVRW